MRQYLKSVSARSGDEQRPSAHRFTLRLGRFLRDESGALIVFGLIMFVMMLIIGGIAVDIMRFETVRGKLQSTADRAALAAAALSSTQDPTAVVNDYFAKEQLSQYLIGITVVSSGSFRSVTANVQAEVPTYFMPMIGVNSLTAPADSSAEESVADVEVSLVLDVSGSMRSNSRLTNLKVAAKNFVDTLLAGDVEGRVSITIIPFSGQVNMGATLAANYTLSTQHTLNTCVDFPTADFSTAAVLPGTLLTRSDPIDPWSNTATKASLTSFGFPAGTEMNYCSTATNNVVRPYLRDIPTLKAIIDGLAADGNTSINMGVKWAIAMLDPGTQPVIDNLIATGQVSAAFAGRPFAYNSGGPAKVIIVMSDGENTSQWTARPSYKSGPSPIDRDPVDGSLAVFHATVAAPNQYYVIPQANFSTSYTGSALGTWQSTVPAGYVNLTWPEVFNLHPVIWVARYMYGNALGTTSSTRQSIATTWRSNLMTSVAPSVMNTQLDAACDLAKAPAQNIRVFTVAFEAPLAGQTALLNCASSDGDYFQTTGTGIIAVFEAIARQISQLRLTQ